MAGSITWLCLTATSLFSLLFLFDDIKGMKVRNGRMTRWVFLSAWLRVLV